MNFHPTVHSLSHFSIPSFPSLPDLLSGRWLLAINVRGETVVIRLDGDLVLQITPRAGFAWRVLSNEESAPLPSSGAPRITAAGWCAVEKRDALRICCRLSTSQRLNLDLMAGESGAELKARVLDPHAH